MAVRMKALIDAKFENKRNAEEARRAVLVKAILEAKEQAASFTVDVADIFDTYEYIKDLNAQIGSSLWSDMVCNSIHFNSDFANDFPIHDKFNGRWVFRSHAADGCYLVVSRNVVVLRQAPAYHEDLDINTLTAAQAEEFLSRIKEFNEGFPQYVEHFFKLVENIKF